MLEASKGTVLDQAAALRAMGAGDVEVNLDSPWGAHVGPTREVVTLKDVEKSHETMEEDEQ